MSDRGLRRGDIVEVRSAAEILVTLDDRGELDSVPFMPEMLEFCGRRFTVTGRADKVCDTVTSDLNSRRLPDTVFLDDLRCDGSGHEGCQAECRIYWKEAWLRRVDGERRPSNDDDDATDALRRLVLGQVTNGESGTTRRFRCQATALVAASEPLKVADPRPYIRELSNGNVTFRRWVKVMGRASVMQPAQRAGWLKSPVLAGSSASSPSTPPPLHLQPGEWVRVKSPREIESTLNDKGRNRGLWFDREMLAFCGGTYQVRKRVTSIIDEPTGEMLHFGGDCIMLEGVVCSGERSTGRWFCARQIYPYWRECWLERIDPPSTAASPR